MVRHRTNGVERRKHTLADSPSAFRLESSNANGDIRSEIGTGQRDLREEVTLVKGEWEEEVNIQRDDIGLGRHL